MKLLKYSIIVFLILTFSSCRKKENLNPDPIPFVAVNTTINLAIKGNFTLVPGSFFYENGGYRGLVVVHDFDGNYHVFDRACSYQPQSGCSILEIDSSSIQLRCGNYSNGNFMECCTSRFNLTGFPLTGPATFAIREYRTALSGDILNVFN